MPLTQTAQDILVGWDGGMERHTNQTTLGIQVGQPAQDILVGLIGDHRGCGGLSGRNLINNWSCHVYDDVLFIVVGPAFLNDQTNALVQVFC